MGAESAKDPRKDERPTVPLEDLFASRLNNLGEALQRTTQRHALIANNLANVNTPGFKRKDMDFNIVLDSKLHPADVRVQQHAQEEDQRQSDLTSLRQDGNNVDLEREVMAMSESELRYETLTDLTSEYFGGLKSAIREGK